MTYKLEPFCHYCSDNMCGTMVQNLGSGHYLVQRWRLRISPQYYLSFDTRESAEAWAAKRGDTIE